MLLNVGVVFLNQDVDIRNGVNFCLETRLLMNENTTAMRSPLTAAINISRQDFRTRFIALCSFFPKHWWYQHRDAVARFASLVRHISCSSPRSTDSCDFKSQFINWDLKSRKVAKLSFYKTSAIRFLIGLISWNLRKCVECFFYCCCNNMLSSEGKPVSP